MGIGYSEEGWIFKRWVFTLDCRFVAISARVHTPQHSLPLPRSCDPWVDARVKNSMAHLLVRRPAAAGGGQWSLITKKCIISGALAVTAEMSASWSWIIGNFTIIWSLSRRGVVFKFAIWEGSAKWHLLGRCTLMRWQWNGQENFFKIMQKWIDNSWTTCHVMRSQGKRQLVPFLRSHLTKWEYFQLTNDSTWLGSRSWLRRTNFGH